MNRWCAGLTLILWLAGPAAWVFSADTDARTDVDPDEWLTLERLVELADEYNPILRRDQARVQAAEGDAVQAGLYPNPRFDTNNPEVFSGRGTALNAGVMQEIVTKGKLRLDKAAATKAINQAQYTYRQDRLALLTNVRQQFFTVLAAQRRVEVLTELIEITKNSVNIGTQLQEKAGEASEIEVLLLTIDSQRVQADFDNAVAVLEAERKQLSTIVGLPYVVNRDVIGSLVAKPPKYDEEILKHYVSSDSTFVQIAKLDIDRNKILLKRAEAEPYPNVTVGPAYQFGTAQGVSQFWFNVQFPIPTTNRNQGGIRSARASIRDTQENLAVIQLDLLGKVADALGRHRAATAQAQRYKTQIIPKAVRTMRLASSGYKEGLFTFASYLQAQRTVVETNIAYINILETAWTTAAELAGLLQIEQFP